MKAAQWARLRVLAEEMLETLGPEPRPRVRVPRGYDAESNRRIAAEMGVEFVYGNQYVKCNPEDLGI